MSEELKPCPFCGSKPIFNLKEADRVNCSLPGCYMSEVWREYGLTIQNWQDRPIEDALRAEIAAMERVVQAAVNYEIATRWDGDFTTAHKNLIAAVREYQERE